MITHIPGSEVSTINQSAGVQSVTVSPELFKVIDRPLYWGRKTDRALDTSVGPVQELSTFDIDHPSPPDKIAIEQKLSKVGYDQIHLENQTVFLAEEGM
jgi:FAD:protein FMN transferase